MCVEGCLCVILSFERFKIFPTQNYVLVCVIHESACVVNPSSMRDYARDTRRPSVLMRRNWFETAHVHVRPLTPHVHIAHEPCMYHVHSTDNRLQNMERSRSVRVWTRSVSDSWIGRAPDVRGILHRICSYASTCAICQWFVSDCKWYVRGSFVIRQWFLLPTPRKIGQFFDAQARTNPICAWFVRDQLWDWPFRIIPHEIVCTGLSGTLSTFLGGDRYAPLCAWQYHTTVNNIFSLSWNQYTCCIIKTSVPL
jgi:hypothetical protein